MVSPESLLLPLFLFAEYSPSLRDARTDTSPDGDRDTDAERSESSDGGVGLRGGKRWSRFEVEGFGRDGPVDIRVWGERQKGLVAAIGVVSCGLVWCGVRETIRLVLCYGS